MVWGMLLPRNFGEFWPRGDFEWDPETREGGWHPRLSAHYREQAPEEQKRLFDYRSDYGSAAHFYGGHAIGKFAHETGASDGPDLPPFGPIEPHEPPRSFVTERMPPTLGSMIMLTNHILAVDEDLKAIIERLEPGVHQFFPIEIKTRRGVVFPRNFYILFINQYLDSFSPEHSGELTKDIKGRAFYKVAFGDAHLWRDRRSPLLNCFSDDLISEIADAGLRIPKHYRMKEIMVAVH